MFIEVASHIRVCRCSNALSFIYLCRYIVVNHDHYAQGARRMLRGGPTKPEVVAIALEKLHIQRDETFADIGCGTGYVSIAASKYTNRIIAVDKRKEAIKVAQQNFKHAGVSDAITLAWGEAPDVLKQYESTIDKAFIGGTANFKGVIKFLIPRCKRLVLNAARLERATESIRYMKELGIFDEVLLITIAKGHELKGLTAFESQNPIFMVVGTC